MIDYYYDSPPLPEVPLDANGGKVASLDKTYFRQFCIAFIFTL